MWKINIQLARNGCKWGFVIVIRFDSEYRIINFSLPLKKVLNVFFVNFRNGFESWRQNQHQSKNKSKEACCSTELKLLFFIWVHDFNFVFMNYVNVNKLDPLFIEATSDVLCVPYFLKWFPQISSNKVMPCASAISL